MYTILFREIVPEWSSLKGTLTTFSFWSCALSLAECGYSKHAGNEAYKWLFWYNHIKALHTFVILAIDFNDSEETFAILFTIVYNYNLFAFDIF